MAERTCVVCVGALPEGSSARRIYCSDRCSSWAVRHLNERRCTSPGCDSPHRARGMCSRHYNDAFAADRHASVEVPCAVCGKIALKGKSNGKKRRSVCSVRCRTILAGGTHRSRDVVGPVPRRAPAARSTLAPLTVVRSAGGRFFSGRCVWCEEQFTVRTTGTVARYCSQRCINAVSKSKSGRFVVAPPARLAIYERDGWLCQLCYESVDRASVDGDWSPSLDHIIPRSRQLVPDDSSSNLRLTHRWCNSVRGDDTYHTAADLVAPVVLSA